MVKKVLYASFPPIIPRMAMSQKLGNSDLQYNCVTDFGPRRGAQGSSVSANLLLYSAWSLCTKGVCVYSKSDFFYHWCLAVIWLIRYTVCKLYLGKQVYIHSVIHLFHISLIFTDVELVMYMFSIVDKTIINHLLRLG